MGSFIKNISRAGFFAITLGCAFFLVPNTIFAQTSSVGITGSKSSAYLDSQNLNERFLQVVNERIDIANEKQQAYEKGINEIKIYISFFGSLLVLIAIAFGYSKNKELVKAKDELLKEVVGTKEYLERMNELSVKEKVFIMEKSFSLKASEFVEGNLGNIKDLQKRIKKLENKEEEGNFENKPTLKDDFDDDPYEV
jgi:hypothetical protein